MAAAHPYPLKLYFHISSWLQVIVALSFLSFMSYLLVYSSVNIIYLIRIHHLLFEFSAIRKCLSITSISFPWFWTPTPCVSIFSTSLDVILEQKMCRLMNYTICFQLSKYVFRGGSLSRSGSVTQSVSHGYLTKLENELFKRRYKWIQ